MSMNTEKLEEVLNNLISLLEESATFTKTEIPLLLQEILTYSLWENIIAAFLQVGFFSLPFSYVLYKVIRYCKAKKGIWTDFEFSLCFPGFTISVAGLFLSILAFVDNVLNIVKVTVAPRLFLLEYLRELIK